MIETRSRGRPRHEVSVFFFFFYGSSINIEHNTIFPYDSFITVGRHGNVGCFMVSFNVWWRKTLAIKSRAPQSRRRFRFLGEKNPYKHRETFYYYLFIFYILSLRFFFRHDDDVAYEKKSQLLLDSGASTSFDTEYYGTYNNTRTLWRREPMIGALRGGRPYSIRRVFHTWLNGKSWSGGGGGTKCTSEKVFRKDVAERAASSCAPRRLPLR